MRRNSISFLLISSYLLLSSLWGGTVRAEATPVRTGHLMGNGCTEQVFAGSLQYTLDGGASWQPVQYPGQVTLRSIYACPITSAVKLGSLQTVAIMADQHVMMVYASPDGSAYYVHREWRVYAITAAQWRSIVGSLVVNVGNRK